jgi:hypothetical protein
MNNQETTEELIERLRDNSLQHMIPECVESVAMREAADRLALLKAAGDEMAGALAKLCAADPVVAAYGEHTLPDCACAFCSAGRRLTAWQNTGGKNG